MDQKNRAESPSADVNDQSSFAPTTKMSRTRPGRRGLARIFAATLITAFITYYTCIQWFGIIRAAPSYAGQGAADNSELILGNKVPLEAHIISKCPDTRVCSALIFVPTMLQLLTLAGCLAGAHSSCDATCLRQGRFQALLHWKVCLPWKQPFASGD